MTPVSLTEQNITSKVTAGASIPTEKKIHLIHLAFNFVSPEQNLPLLCRMCGAPLYLIRYFSFGRVQTGKHC